jgi:YD repeat-containing protein
MVAIVAGKGTGLERSSAFVLGSQGQLGSSLQGRGGDGVFVNAASGNLVITRQDEFLIGLGPDAAISRTYNSLATVGDGDNNDKWQASLYRRIIGTDGDATVTRVDWDGSETIYTKVSAHNYICKDGDGAYDTLVYGGSQWTWQDGDSRIRDIYNSSGKLTSTSDLDGNSLTYTYTGALITRVTTQNGEYTNLTYNGSNQLTDLVTYYDATHLTRVFYTYDGSGRLEKVKVNLDPTDNSSSTGANYETTYTYHSTSNRVASISQTDGSLLTIGYTLVGSDYRVTSLTQTVVSGVTRSTTLSYDTTARTTTITDNAGNVVLMRYDASDQLTAITYPPATLGAPAQTMSFAYNGNGDVISQTDAMGRTVNYTYDSNGNMLSSQDAAGNRVERTYGSNNELLTLTRFLVADSDGVGSSTAGTPLVTRYIYSATENHLRFVVTAEGEVTEYGYDTPGQQTSAISYTASTYTSGTFTEAALSSWASGLSDRSTVQRTDTAYTGRGSIDTVTRYSAANSSGVGLTGSDYSVDTYTYDQAGQLLTRKNSASSASEVFVYDGLGRVTSSTDLAGNTTTIAFTDASTTTTVTLANNLVRLSVYNKAGELLTYTESGSDFTTAVTTSKYDSLGRLRMVTDATNRTVYMLYDNAGRKVADIGPDGAVTEYRYDASNNVTSTTRYLNKLTTGAGSQLASLIDGSGNPANIALGSIRPSASAGDQWSFNIYDAASRLVQTIDATGATSVFTYDGASQLVSTVRYANSISSTTIADLKAKATNPNIWANPANAGAWPIYNLTATANGTMQGVTAFTMTTIGSLGGAFWSTAVPGHAGDLVSYTISMKAIAGPHPQTGIYASSGWGDAQYSTASISTGPGTIISGGGAYWGVYGLSTTDETRITITRKLLVDEDICPGFYLDANSSILVGAPVLSITPQAPILPAANSASDQLTRNFYDNDGRLVAVLDGAGGLSEIFYDEAGRKIREIGHATAVASGLRAAGSLSALQGSAGTSSADRRIDYVYDGRGFLRFQIDASAHPTEYVYDARGNVIRTIDYAGSIASTSSYSLAYVQAQLTSTGLASNSNNRISRVTYDDAGRAAFTIGAMGAVVEFKYDNVNRVVKQIAYNAGYGSAGDKSLATMATWATGQASDALNHITRNIYDKAGHLAYVVDGENYITRFDYDEAGRVTKERRYDGTFTIGDSDTKTTVATILSAVTSGAWVDVSNAYDSAGRLETRTDGVGAVTRFTYDGLGQVIDTTLAYGTSDATTTRRAYDAAGRVTSETGAYGVSGVAATVTYAYDAVGNLLTRTDALNHATTFTYDNVGRALTSSVPVNGTSGDNLVTINEYDALGDLVKVTDARGGTAFSYYNALGQLTLQVDQELYATATSYTIFGQTASVTRYAARTTSPAPTVTTPPTIVTGALDATTSFTYDKAGRLTRVTDAEGYHEDYSLGTFGERWRVDNKAGGYFTYQYDRLGRMYGALQYVNAYRADGSVQASSFFQTLQAFDSRGNVTWKAEAYFMDEQRISGYAYDKANRLIQTFPDAVTVTAGDMSGTSSTAPTETYSYNLRGQLIQSVDAGGGKLTSWYDALGRKTDEVNAAGTLTHWTYDANGNALTMRTYDTAVSVPGSPPSTTPPTGSGTYREISYGYDWANRLTTTTVASLAFGVFDGTNYVTTLSGETITQRYYDKNGNVVAEVDGLGNVNWAWYDGLGRLVAQIDRENYLTVRELDANGNSIAETRYASKITGSFGISTAYYGPLLALVTPNSALDRTTTFTYDRNGHRLTERRWYVDASTVSGAGALSTSSQTAIITYTYNALGLVATRTEANGDVTDYGYDSFGRLTSITGPAYLDQTGTSVRRLTENFHDAFGRVVRTEVNKVGGASGDDRVTTFVYGVGDRLNSSTDAAGFTHYFGYDIAGRVVQDKWTRTKSDGSTTVTEATNYRYDAAGRMITQANATWNGSAWIFGEATRLQYNAHGEVIGKGITAAPTSTAVYQETFDYDAGGRLWRTNSGDGSIKLMFYDKAGNATMTLSSVGADLSSYTATGALATFSGAGVTSIANAVTSIAVFDKRGQQLATREPGRQLSSSTTATLTGSRTYNAFGEVLSETDARSYTTDFSYNSMGRLIQKQSPTVNWTSESGATTTARPTENYYYDLSGRLVGVRDANNNLTTRALLAGTGMSKDEEALVTAEFHTDGGIARSFYDVFGDMRIQRSELYVSGSTTDFDEVYSYDKMGRATSVQHRGNLLTDTYVYDGLGQRVKHYNSYLGSTVADLTDYDLQGRLVSQADMGGDTTTYAYSWSDSLATGGMSTYGGWVKTTVNAAGKSMTEGLDYFGHTVARTDFGGHVYTFTFDKGARMTARSNTAGESMSFGWFNTGLAASVSFGSGNSSAYAYDEAGNRTLEWTQVSSAVVQNATASYDALNRMIGWAEAGSSSTPAATLAIQYDLNGNIRRSLATHSHLDNEGNVATGTYTQDYWYLYDSMNRFVLTKGSLSGSTIVRGTDGVGLSIAYDMAGQRQTVTKTVSTAYSVLINEATGQYKTVYKNLNTIDDYNYNASGFLKDVWLAEDTYDPEVGGGVQAGVSKQRSNYTLDAMGRTTLYEEYDTSTTPQVMFSRATTYNNRSQVTAETQTRKIANGSGGTDIFVDATTNYFNATETYSGSGIWLGTSSGGSYMGGSITYSTTYSTKNGADNDTAAPDTSLKQRLTWWDGAKQVETLYDRNTDDSGNALWDTDYTYNGSGNLISATIDDDRDRTVNFIVDANGMILQRREVSSTPAGDPRDIHYMFAGMKLGDVSNNGTGNVDFSTALMQHRMQPQFTSSFRGNGVSSPYADFDQSYDAVNGDSLDGTGARYVVHDGETLQSIALASFGDSSLWYLIAEANGLNSASQLVAGQSIVIPNKVANLHNNSGTFRIYDPNEAIGNLAPTSPKPKKNGAGCAMVGQILMVIIAVAVSAVVAPWATGVIAGEGASMIGGLAAAALGGAIGGAAGAVASQSFGIVTGMQKGFDWKGIGMAAIGGAIGGGLGKLQGLAQAGKLGSSSSIFGKAGILAGGGFVNGAVRGVASNLLTQGVGVATGLQNKFSWLGVATAGVGGGVSGQIGKWMAGDLQAGRVAPTLANGLASAGSAVANAGLRSLVTGTSFGDNLLAALPDVVGGTIGGIIAGTVQGSSRDPNADAQSDDTIAKKIDDAARTVAKKEQETARTIALKIFGANAAYLQPAEPSDMRRYFSYIKDNIEEPSDINKRVAGTFLRRSQEGPQPITRDESARFLQTLRESGRFGEIIQISDDTITIQQASDLEHRMNFSNVGSTFKDLNDPNSVIWLLNRVTEWIELSDTVYAARRSQQITYPTSSRLGQTEGNVVDAYRHAVWTAAMVRTMGVERAKLIGDAHERDDGSRGGHLMDLVNNHNTRVLAQVFPGMSAGLIARYAVGMGMVKTSYYNIITPK